MAAVAAGAAGPPGQAPPQAGIALLVSMDPRALAACYVPRGIAQALAAHQPGALQGAFVAVQRGPDLLTRRVLWVEHGRASGPKTDSMQQVGKSEGPMLRLDDDSSCSLAQLCAEDIRSLPHARVELMCCELHWRLAQGGSSALQLDEVGMLCHAVPCPAARSASPCLHMHQDADSAVWHPVLASWPET